METRTQQPNTSGHPNIKPALTLVFFLLSMGIIWGIGVLAEIALLSGGYGQAVTSLGSLIIGLFVLFLISFLLFALLTYAVRRGLIIPRSGSPLDRVIRFWKKLIPPYDVRPILDAPTEPITDADLQENWLRDFTPADVDEMMEFIANQKGRGRKSIIPDDQRFRAVRDWTVMQMKGTSVRLQDFLDERFGYQHDGSPNVPRDTFYGWYKKFKKMLLEYKAIKKQ
jgi:hypothetical protein